MKNDKTYGVRFFDSFDQARSASQEILNISKHHDQVNIVIREEGDMDDPQLLGIHGSVKVYAGTAWTSIHERRCREGWYKK